MSLVFHVLLTMKFFWWDMYRLLDVRVVVVDWTLLSMLGCLDFEAGLGKTLHHM